MPRVEATEACRPQEQGQGVATCLQPPERAQLHAGPRGLPTSKALSTAMAGTHHPTAALPSALAARSSACCSDFWAWAVSHSPAQHLSRETDTADPPDQHSLQGFLPSFPPPTPVLLSPPRPPACPDTHSHILSGVSCGTALPAALILLQAQPPITAPSSPAARQNTWDAKRLFRGQGDTATARLAWSMCHLPAQHAAIPAGPTELLPHKHNSPFRPIGCSQDHSSPTEVRKGKPNRKAAGWSQHSSPSDL